MNKRRCAIGDALNNFLLFTIIYSSLSTQYVYSWWDRALCLGLALVDLLSVSLSFKYKHVKERVKGTARNWDMHKVMRNQHLVLMADLSLRYPSVKAS